MSFARFHRRLLAQVDAMRDGEGVAPSPAWQIYANTGMLACIDALAANYPSLVNLMGASQFADIAARFVRATPPDDARLFLYGATLPAWLHVDAGGPRAAIAAATLDRAWTEVHAEADAPMLDMAWIGQQGAGTFDVLCLQPAPATRWLADASTPLWDWWQALRAPAPALQPGGGQAVLLTRPADTVLVQQLPLAGAALLQACETGLSLPVALSRAAACDPTADLQALLGILFGAGAFQRPGQTTARAFPLPLAGPAG